MTTNEFKIGDRVASEDAKYSGIVTTVDDMGCKVHFADGEELYFLKDILHHSGLPDYDRKTAFLTELQALLRKYDAEIVFHCDYDLHTLSTSIIVGGCELRRNEVYGVCPINIMDFNKE